MASGATRIHPRKVPEPLGLQAIRSKDQPDQDPTGPDDFRVFPPSPLKVWGRAGVEPLRAECGVPRVRTVRNVYVYVGNLLARCTAAFVRLVADRRHDRHSSGRRPSAKLRTRWSAGSNRRLDVHNRLES